MMNKLNTIASLFRPNYNIYKPSSKVLKIEEPEQDIYDPDQVYRIRNVVKKVLTELPQDEQEEFVGELYNDMDYLSASQLEIDTEGDYQNQDYVHFKQQLDKFIEEHPEYENIKDSLQHLANLESSYKMSISNKAGSGALGWFQFMDGTRNVYNSQTREQFANDPQAQLLAAAQHYTKLQHEVQKRGGNPNDFVTMYAAWWRPESAYAYIKNPDYDYSSQYNEGFQQIVQRARNLVNKNGKGNS